jgi:hypothetical protein
LAVRKIQKREQFRIRRNRLDVVTCDDGFLVTIGPVSLLLDRAAAQEVMCLLADALEPGDPLDISPVSSN